MMQTDGVHGVSLQEFSLQLESVPGGKNFFARMSAASFDEFVSVLYRDIDDVIKSMESNPQMHSTDEEDKLTYFIATMLKQRQYRTRFGETLGGSVDLTVEGRKEDFVWTSEAKIYRSLPKVREGFLQLHTRYAPADLLNDKVGLLIYIRREGAADLMKEWRKELPNLGFKEITTADCPMRPGLAFLSTHKSERSGLNTTTRHMSVSVFHDPRDASGLKAMKHVNARRQRQQEQ